MWVICVPGVRGSGCLGEVSCQRSSASLQGDAAGCECPVQQLQGSCLPCLIFIFLEIGLALIVDVSFLARHSPSEVFLKR